jgi:hypothetical protein
MTPAEAEEVLKRFRFEEEQRQREMEAAAANPTVADLAEGLGVPEDRIARLLAQVRGDGPPSRFQAEPITVGEAQAVVRRSNQVAWVIAAVILGSLLVLVIFAAVFFARTEVRVNQPTPPETTAPPSFESAEPIGPLTD